MEARKPRYSAKAEAAAKAAWEKLLTELRAEQEKANASR